MLCGISFLDKSSSPEGDLLRSSDARAEMTEPNSSLMEIKLDIKQQNEDTVDNFYKLVGPRKLPMNLPKDVVIERINEGLSKMIAERTKVFPDEEVLSIESAYYRMIRTVIFMGSIYPEWGVDHGDYFVFSGQPDMKKDLHFKYGYTVKKEDGMLYRWWYSQEELDEAIAAEENGR